MIVSENRRPLFRIMHEQRTPQDYSIFAGKSNAAARCLLNRA